MAPFPEKQIPVAAFAGVGVIDAVGTVFTTTVTLPEAALQQPVEFRARI